MRTMINIEPMEPVGAEVPRSIPPPPPDIDTAAYAFTLNEELVVPAADGTDREVHVVAFAMEKLKNNIAQSLSGARYEHYKPLPVDVVAAMCDHILNDRLAAPTRAILTSGKLIPLDKVPAPPQDLPLPEQADPPPPPPNGRFGPRPPRFRQDRPRQARFLKTFIRKNIFFKILNRNFRDLS